MRSLPALIAVLLIPVVPFLIWHESIDAWARQHFQVSMSPVATATWIVGLLATDIFLPIPSSLISTLGGSRLPPLIAVAASWLGMSIGAALGFAASRLWGRAWALRAMPDPQSKYLQERESSRAAWLLATTRGLPVLAEATVLWLGAHGLTWRQFLPPVLLANLGLAVAYSGLGRVAANHAWLPVALGISVALPLLLSRFVQRRGMS